MGPTIREEKTHYRARWNGYNSGKPQSKLPVSSPSSLSTTETAADALDKDKEKKKKKKKLSSTAPKIQTLCNVDDLASLTRATWPQISNHGKNKTLLWLCTASQHICSSISSSYAFTMFASSLVSFCTDAPSSGDSPFVCRCLCASVHGLARKNHRAVEQSGNHLLGQIERTA